MPVERHFKLKLKKLKIANIDVGHNISWNFFQLLFFWAPVLHLSMVIYSRNSANKSSKMGAVLGNWILSSVSSST